MFDSIINYLGYNRYGNLRIRLQSHHLWWGYIAAGILTFGYNASNYPVMNYSKDCVFSPQPIATCERELDHMGTGLKAIAAGAGWPLFWSWEIME